MTYISFTEDQKSFKERYHDLSDYLAEFLDHAAETFDPEHVAQLRMVAGVFLQMVSVGIPVYPTKESNEERIARLEELIRKMPNL